MRLGGMDPDSSEQKISSCPRISALRTPRDKGDHHDAKPEQPPVFEKIASEAIPMLKAKYPTLV
jgi:hypothetical protein